jgi:outer membrane protein TolC
MHAASAQVGVAVANMLPNFTMNGNVGYTAPALQILLTIFRRPMDFLSWREMQHRLYLTVLHCCIKSAQQKRAAAQYRVTVINSLQNVADTLRALQGDANSLKAAAEFERAAKISFDLVRQQFETGYANVILLLNAQQTYLQARIAVIQARANRLADTVALFQALGGGWWNREEVLAAVRSEN